MKVDKDNVVQVRVSRREKSRWEAVAADAELSLSELVRAAVREHVGRLSRETPPALASRTERRL